MIRQRIKNRIRHLKKPLFIGIAVIVLILMLHRFSLIQGDDVQTILSGVWITVVIAVATLFLGSIASLFFSMLIRSRIPVVSHIFQGISKVLDTVPILIILMLLYYGVFADTKVSGVWIGIFGLTLGFANNAAALLNTGLAGVDQGQLQAAESMGYRENQIFFKISFPQAFQQMYGQFRLAILAMVKDTSIVGYINVQDLTGVSNAMLSSSYHSLLPLLFTTVVYFLIAEILYFVLDEIIQLVDPRAGRAAGRSR